jgi:hypothetical protein
MRLNGWQRIGNEAVYSLTRRSQRRLLFWHELIPGVTEIALIAKPASPIVTVKTDQRLRERGWACRVDVLAAGSLLNSLVPVLVVPQWKSQAGL